MNNQDSEKVRQDFELLKNDPLEFNKYLTLLGNFYNCHFGFDTNFNNTYLKCYIKDYDLIPNWARSIIDNKGLKPKDHLNTSKNPDSFLEVLEAIIDGMLVKEFVKLSPENFPGFTKKEKFFTFKVKMDIGENGENYFITREYMVSNFGNFFEEIASLVEKYGPDDYRTINSIVLTDGIFIINVDLFD